MKQKISIALNTIIVIFSVIGTVLMLLGIQFMGPEDGFSAKRIEMFRFYTVDSNVLMGIASLFFIIYELKLINKKIDKIPTKIYILKLIATVGVTLTFLVVVLYLAPIASYGYFSMFRNANLFFHLLVPVLSIITFCFLEKTESLEFKHTFIGISTMILYTIFYATNILIHAENGKVSPIYDWYWFVQKGVWSIVIVIPIISGFTYLISLSLWKINKSNNKVKCNRD